MSFRRFAPVKWLLVIFALTTAYPSYAQDTGRFIESLERPSLVLFYSHDCLPCQAELHMLPALTAEAKGWDVTIATVTKPDNALIAATGDAKVRLIDVSADGVAIVRSLSKAQIAMPFSLATDKRGAICARRTGIMGTDIVTAWRRTCSI